MASKKSPMNKGSARRTKRLARTNANVRFPLPFTQPSQNKQFPETFEVLKEKVFPALVEGRADNGPLRIWALGCSTGEEAYSIAIAFLEFAADRAEHVPIQIFATDLNGVAIERARAGFYPKSLTNDVSPERLRRFFVKIEGGYRISKPIRDMCVFSRQNALTDPPFSRMDLVSCRNLLIDLEPASQKKVIRALHYALKPSGFLLLGSSETIGSFSDLFKLEDEKHKLYSKKPGPSRMRCTFTPGPYAVEMAEADRKTVRVGEGVVVETDTQREADRILLQKYAPASVLVDADWEVLQIRGSTAPYLESPPGSATHNLLKMAREGLHAPLRTALHQAKKDDRPVRVEGLRVKFNGHARDFNLEVIPVKSMTANDRSFLAIFESAPPAVELEPAQAKATEADSGRGAAQRQTAELQSELNAAREYLQSVIEQQEAYYEELQSANEEIQSTNEELQSINEELDTAREELQSSNEELTTTNEELHNLNQEVNQVNNDLGNLLSNVPMPIIMLGKDLRIRRFTSMAERSLNLVANDLGRPITDLDLNLNLRALPELLMGAIDSVSAMELEVQDQQGRWYSLRIQPYETSESRIDGVVMVLIDIERLKRADEKLRQQNRLIESPYEPIFIWDFDTGIVEWNHGCEQLYGFTRAEAVGSNNHELLRTIHPLSLEEFKARLAAQGEWTGELRHTTKDGRDVIVESRQQLSKTDGRWLVLETNRDITARKQAEEAMRESEERLRLAQEVAQVGTFEWDIQTGVDRWSPKLEEMYGLPIGGFAGTYETWESLVHPDDRAEAMERVRLAIETGNFEGEWRVVWPDGTERWLVGRASVLKDESGRPLRMIG